MKGNAIISSVSLGYEDHGILTCWLCLKQKGSGQCFGGWCLDTAPKKDEHGHYYGDRQPSVYCGFWVKRILETVGVRNWEDLVGKHVIVVGEEFGEITGIGHITDDKWFFPKKEIAELEKEARTP
jgi:hypothetical protein